MKTGNISIRAYAEETVKSASQKEEQEKKNGNVIRANELNIVTGMSVTEKRINKERSALKIKLEQMLSDQEYSDEMKAHTDRQKIFQEESLSNEQEAKKIEELKQVAKEAYGVTDDSSEQKKLEEIEALREKEKSGEILTEEEQALLDDTESLTDYQKLILEYDDAIDEFKDRAEKAQQNAMAHGAAADGMKQALLQVQPMVDASKQAKEMILSALKEEQSALLEEMKEKYDEKAVQEKEEAKEAQEKREELYGTEEKSSSEETMDGLLEASNHLAMDGEALKKKLLLEEDLKGIEVDEIV